MIEVKRYHQDMGIVQIAEEDGWMKGIAVKHDEVKKLVSDIKALYPEIDFD